MASTDSPLPPLRFPGLLGLGLFFSALALAFLCLFLAYPQVPWSGDDWDWLAKWSWFYPSLSRFNPARVFPEAFMPFSGYLAAYVFMPLFSLGYVQALILTSSLASIASLLIVSATAYRLFSSVVKDRFSGCCLTVIFLSCFFIGQKQHLPAGFPLDGTCLLFYYYMPNMLNLALLLELCRMYASTLRQPETFLARRFEPKSLQERSLFFVFFLLSAYLTQFSMTVSSIISAAYAGAVFWGGLLSACLVARSPTRGMREYFHGLSSFQVMLLTIVVFWFICALFELLGERYADVARQEAGPFFATAFSTLKAVARLLPSKISNLLASLSLCAAAIFSWRAYKKELAFPDGLFIKSTGLLLLACTIVLLLNILVAVTSFDLGPRALFGVLCFIFLQIGLTIAYIAAAIPVAKLLVPFLALHMLVVMWKAPEWPQRPLAIASYRLPIVEQWVKDARQAEAQGLSSVTVYTPTEEWPHDKDGMGGVLAQAFYRHGIISRPMTITISSSISPPKDMQESQAKEGN